MRIDDLLKALVASGGSDLHLIVGKPPAIRTRGELMPVAGWPDIDVKTAKDILYEILNENQIKSFETDPNFRYELDFAYSLPGIGRFRCNVHKQRGTMAATIRALATKIPTLESLNLPESVKFFTEIRKGLALVTGPTGSGKSTTLASIIDRINTTRRDHIITIEDPIEYLHSSKMSYVTQREVGDSADTLSFSNALKYALRQDPDVILIGEMRDYVTIGIAITSAETGHLVFGTLHTNSASQTIGRMVDVFPVDQQPQIITQLSSNLVGVLSQILMPTADGKGRVCACEVMKANAAIRNNVRSGNIDQIYQSIQTGQREGMQTMDQALTELVESGKVAYERALPYLRDDITKRNLVSFAGRVKEPEVHAPSAPQRPPSSAPISAPQGTPIKKPAGSGSDQILDYTPRPINQTPDGQPRKRLGDVVIPPWEKQKRDEN